MKTIEKKAYAKVNLFLNVLDKNETGYHNLEMINAKINLFDEIKVTISDIPGMVVIQSNDLFLSNQNNIVYDAASYMIHQFVPLQGIMVEINKNIPFGAGLAGNSADAACLIECINEVFELHLDDSQLCEIGLRFGADIPYCFHNGFALIEGVGEKITPLNFNLNPYKILLVNPRVFVPTKDVFDLGDQMGFERRSVQDVMESIHLNDHDGFIRQMYNVLQKITCEKYETVNEAFDLISKKLGEKGVVMTGSGSTFIKVFEEKDLINVTHFISIYREKYFTEIYSFL